MRTGLECRLRVHTIGHGRRCYFIVSYEVADVLQPRPPGTSSDYRRPAWPDRSISERRARKQHIGADREPERVIADDRYLDEHAKHRENYDNDRSHKPKVHSAYLPGDDGTLKPCLYDHTPQRAAKSSGKINATYELRGLILAIRVFCRLWC